MSSDSVRIVEAMKKDLRAMVVDRGGRGADCPIQGDTECKSGQTALDRIDDIEDVRDVLDYLEVQGIDVKDLVVRGEYGLVAAGLPGEEVPIEVVTDLGVQLAEQSWSGGSWVNVYLYDGKYFVIDEVEVKVFDDEDKALRSAGITVAGFDRIVHMSRTTPENRSNRATRAAAACATESAARKPARPVLIIVTKWPEGTMAIKFGSAICSALKVTEDEITLLQLAPERIFRAKTSVSRARFRASMRKFDFGSAGKTVFVEL